MHDELIKELRLLREEFARAREEDAAEVFSNYDPNQGTQEYKRKGHTYNNSLLGSAGLVFRGKSAKGRLQLVLVILFPLLMALIGLIHPEPISRFDFWLMIPILGISIGFYNTVFLTNIEDRAKVEARWKQYDRKIMMIAKKRGIYLNSSIPLLFKFRVIPWVMLMFLVACIIPCCQTNIPSFTLGVLPTMMIASVFCTFWITRSGGSVEKLKLHIPKRFRHAVSKSENTSQQ